MYQTTIKVTNDSIRFQRVWSTCGTLAIRKMETPMSLSEYCFGSLCDHVSLGYFARSIRELRGAIQVDFNYEEGHFTLAIHLPEDLILENEPRELLAFCG